MKGRVLLVAGLVGVGASLAASTSHLGVLDVGVQDVRAFRTKNEVVHLEHQVQSPQVQTPPKRRVVSASLLSDELLLGILPLESWVAVSYVVDWPSATPASGLFPTGIARTQGTIEDLLSRNADLVVLSEYNNGATFAQIRDLRVPVHLVRTPQSFDDLFTSWRALGVAIGLPERTEIQIARSRAQLNQVRGQAARLTRSPRTLLLQGMFSYGPQTIQGSCMEEAGLSNVLAKFSGEMSPQLNVEHVLTLAPELIFYASDISEPRVALPSDLRGETTLQQMLQGELSHIVLIPGAWMASISHYALAACDAYVKAAATLLERTASKEGGV